MKLRVLNIIKDELPRYCVSNITSHYVCARVFSDLPSRGMKLPPGEKESIEYTLPRDATSRPGYIKISPAMKGRAENVEERRGVCSPGSSWNQSGANLHFCALTRLASAQSTCYTPPSMGRKIPKTTVTFENFLMTAVLHTCTLFSILLFPFCRTFLFHFL